MRKWFAGKTIYRTRVEGAAEPPDADALAELPASYRTLDGEAARDAALIEERVVLFCADTADEAIERAEQEAEAYASGVAVNVFGQRILRRVLDYVETYELDSEPTDAVEVFSRTFLFEGSSEDRKILDCVAPLDDLPSSLRKLFEPNFAQTSRRIGVSPKTD